MRACWHGKQCLQLKLSFPLHKNALFIFRVPEMGDFVKHLSFHRLIIAPAQFSKILGHFMCTIHDASEPVAFLRSGREKDNFLPIQQESGRN